MVRASLFNARLAASPRRAHGLPPSAASPHSRRPPRCARSLQRSPQQRAALDCRRHAPVFGTDPPPRPVSPRTRFAPPLRHSATRAFPPPSDRSARPPAPRPSPASASRHAPCPQHCGCPCPRFQSLSLPPRFVCRLPPASHASLPPAASPHSCRPPRCARRRHPAPHPRPRCGLRPTPASAPRRLRCPHHCGDCCRRFRQRASHACPQLRPQSPPLSRRGGSLPSASPTSISPRLYPGFCRSPPRVAALVLIPDAACCGCALACACRAFPCALDDTGCRAHAGTSVFSRAYTPSSHPCRPRAAHVARRSRDVFSDVAEGVTEYYVV